METQKNKFKRKNSYTIGQDGEIMATNYLKSKSYEIIDMNYHTKYGEIDIIAKQNNEIIFAEVKRRKNSDFGYAYESVNQKKQTRIINSAKMYITTIPAESNYSFRFDILEITGHNLQINHIENAFEVC